MKRVTVQSLEWLRKHHPEVVAYLKPVDNVRYVTSGIGRQVEVPDDVGGVFASRGRDTRGNYYKFHWLPTVRLGGE